MKKLLSFLLGMFLVVILNAQALNVPPAASGYILVNKDCVPCVVKPVPAEKAKPSAIKPHSIITVANKPIVQPITTQPIQIVQNQSDSVIIKNNINVYNSIKEAAFGNSENKTPKISIDFVALLKSQKLRTRGTFKILSGLALQAAGVGIIAYGKIPQYYTEAITTSYSQNYQYTEYQLTPTYNPAPTSKCEPAPVPTPTPVINNDNTNSNVNNNNVTSSSSSSSSATATSNSSTNVTVNVPAPVVNTTVDVNNTIINYNPVTYTLIPITKTGTIKWSETNQVVVERHKNMTGYYVAAGSLGVIGAVLEISGICDLHKSKIKLSSNGIGVSISF